MLGTTYLKIVGAKGKLIFIPLILQLCKKFFFFYLFLFLEKGGNLKLLCCTAV